MISDLIKTSIYQIPRFLIDGASPKRCSVDQRGKTSPPSIQLWFPPFAYFFFFEAFVSIVWSFRLCFRLLLLRSSSFVRSLVCWLMISPLWVFRALLVDRIISSNLYRGACRLCRAFADVCCPTLSDCCRVFAGCARLYISLIELSRPALFSLFHLFELFCFYVGGFPEVVRRLPHFQTPLLSFFQTLQIVLKMKRPSKK